MPDFWPYMAHNETPRSLRTLTEIQTTDDEEFRTPLSPPRKYFEYQTFLTSQEDRFRAEMLGARVSGEVVDVPDWTQHFRYASAIASADTTLTFDTAHRAYAIGDRIVIWENAESYVIATVLAFTATGLTFDAPIGQDFPRATLAPVWEMECIGAVVVNLVSGNTPVVSASFLQIDAEETKENMPTIYDGLGVLLDQAYVSSGDYMAVTHPAQIIDAAVGGVQQEDTRTNARRAYVVSLVDVGQAAMWRRDRWLAYLEGQTRAFWLPSPQNDLELAINSSGGLNFRVFAAGLATDLIGLDLIINGTVIRRVVAVSDLGDQFSIALNATVPAYTVANPPSIRILRKVRVAQDSVDTLYNPALFSVTTLPVIEVAA